MLKNQDILLISDPFSLMLDLGFFPPFALTFDQRSQLITWKTGRFALSLDDFTMIRKVSILNLLAPLPKVYSFF